MWYVYTKEYYSAIKKTEIMPFAAIWMDLDTDLPSELSQREKDKYSSISLIWQVQKMIQMNLSTKQKETHVLREQKYGWRGGKMLGKDN